MLEISFTVTTSIVIFGWCLFRIGAYYKNQNLNWKHEAVQLLFLINLLVINRMVFHPMATDNDRILPLIFDSSTVWPFRMNLIPFVNVLDYDSKRDLLLNLIGNTAMFIPTGIMTPLVYKNLNSFKKTVLTGFSISLAIEIIQLPFAVRASDVDDLILNTLGCVLGYGILTLVRMIRQRIVVR